MAMLDEAKIVPINRVVPCHNKFASINAFGATCEILDPNHKFSVRFIISNMQ
jgi:hypothetical protein